MKEMRLWNSILEIAIDEGLVIILFVIITASKYPFLWHTNPSTLPLNKPPRRTHHARLTYTNRRFIPISRLRHLPIPITSQDRLRASTHPTPSILLPHTQRIRIPTPQLLRIKVPIIPEILLASTKPLQPPGQQPSTNFICPVILLLVVVRLDPTA